MSTLTDGAIEHFERWALPVEVTCPRGCGIFPIERLYRTPGAFQADQWKHCIQYDSCVCWWIARCPVCMTVVAADNAPA